MAKPTLATLIEGDLIQLGKASQKSGLIGSVGLRLAKTKLKERKSILEVLRILVDSKAEKEYLEEFWNDSILENPWTSITHILLEGFESTDGAV